MYTIWATLAAALMFLYSIYIGTTIQIEALPLRLPYAYMYIGHGLQQPMYMCLQNHWSQVDQFISSTSKFCCWWTHAQRNWNWICISLQSHSLSKLMHIRFHFLSFECRYLKGIAKLIQWISLAIPFGYLHTTFVYHKKHCSFIWAINTTYSVTTHEFECQWKVTANQVINWLFVSFYCMSFMYSVFAVECIVCFFRQLFSLINVTVAWKYIRL